MPEKYMTDRAAYITAFQCRPTSKNIKISKNSLNAMRTVVTNRIEKNVTYYNKRPVEQCRILFRNKPANYGT